MRFRASTLLETLISMAMIGGVLTVTMVLYANVLHGDRSLARMRARTLIDATYARITADNAIPMTTHAGTDGTISIEWHPLPRQLREVHVRVADANGRPVLECRRILQGPWRD